MNAPKRLQRERTKGWRKDMVSTNPNGAVIVDRSSKYGNPYSVTINYHDVPGNDLEAQGRREAERGMATILFKTYVKERLKNDPEWLAPLKGKDLLCTCPKGQSCHGDILIYYANYYEPNPQESEPK